MKTSMISSSVNLTALFFGAALSAALSGCGSSASPPTQDGPHVVTIAETRGLAAKSDATVEGFVTVAPGLFSSATSDQGFAIQDDSGGIYVSVASKVDLAPGKKARVTGKLGDVSKLIALVSDPGSITGLDESRVIAPKDVKTGAVNATTEGLLVHVTGVIKKPVGADVPYGYKVYIDDGSGEIQVYLHVSAGFDPAKMPSLKEGNTLQAVGLSARYEATFEVAPRSSQDLTFSP